MPRREQLDVEGLHQSQKAIRCSPHAAVGPTDRAQAMNELARMAAVRPVAVPARPPLAQRLQILGYLSSGTYGRVYKARERISSTGGSPSVGTPTAGWPPKTGEDEGQLCAIKKFKPDKEGEAITYTGISQSACREIMVSRALKGRH